jgi:hypothetical protein
MSSTKTSLNNVYAGERLPFADPLVGRIQTKFSKSYEASAPLELLAFYELQPVSPEALWRSQLHEFVVQNLETSPFRRVWVYDVGNRKVRYVQP